MFESLAALGKFLAKYWVESAMVATTVASTAIQIDQGREARKDQRAAAAEATKAKLLEERRARVAALQERQRATAEVKAAAANHGVQGSAGAAGALSSVESQYGANTGFQFAYTRHANRAAMFGQAADMHAWRADTAGAIGQFTTSAASFAAGMKGSTLFQKKG